ncbi:unnamed protein product [Phytomonas sp. Hart1]|nr:unnamed protein product [Phytomonas sp. Hart1]|eukprot:CCW70530.1 unnamed protein product [Phytomonas sp. isolate Hart1]
MDFFSLNIYVNEIKVLKMWSFKGLTVDLFVVNLFTRILILNAIKMAHFLNHCFVISKMGKIF